MKRPQSAEIPDAPGAYLFRDAFGQVTYVGKAKSLRKRVASYFSRDLAPRTRAMVDSSHRVEWIVVDSEVAALFLEYSLIKEHLPPLQHPPERRQELSLPGDHPLRPVATRPGDAGRQEEGHAVFRTLRPCLRHPQHARPASQVACRSAPARTRCSAATN